MIFGVCFRCVFGESLVLDFVFWLGFFCGGLIVGCDDMTSFPSPFLLFAEKFNPISVSIIVPVLTRRCRSENLARIAIQHQPHSTVVADILQLPHRDAFFDFAISIAVVHHMSTPERRVEAVAEILRTVRRGEGSEPGGKFLVYAWALEQKDSRRGWDKGDPQDIMVPWVRKSKSDQGQEKTFHRYYHLYEEGELERDIEQAGGVVLESGYEKDNWWAIATPKPASTSASASAS